MDEGLTIAETADRTGLSAYTLRYYERAGLLRAPARAVNGHRRYGSGDLTRIGLITKLRDTGMSIADIRRYFVLVEAGPHTRPERRRLLLAHRARVVGRIAQLREDLALIDHKISLYERQEKETTMRERVLGQGLASSALGLGCMGMSEFYGPGDDAESVKTVHRALDLGVTHLDTSDMYGPFTNEMLVGRAIKGRREEVLLATKFGIERRPDGTRAYNGRPEYVRACCEASLRRLGVDHIDLYYQHRVDPQVPVEETWGALAELVAEGKVRHLGISEASPQTLRRAHAVHPISAGQYEYSLFARDVEEDVLPVLRELGIGLVAYSPLGRGFLTGAITSRDQFAAGDFRTVAPRFQGANFDQNLRLAERVRETAEAKGVSAAQLALAWVLSRGEDVVPIPGTKRLARLEENAAARDVELTAEDLAALERAVPAGAVAGERYPDMRTVRQ